MKRGFHSFKGFKGFALVAVAGVAVAALPRLALSADHADGSLASALANDPRVDITDFYGWVDGKTNRVVFVMDVFPSAVSQSVFSDAAQYVVHTSSMKAFGGSPGLDAGAAVEEDAIATFDATGKVISLWIGTDEFVTGDPTADKGLSSADGKVVVFAGRRQDPFFFNLAGFKATANTIKSTSLTLDTAGCPALDTPTASALATSLKTTDGGAPVDAFAKANVLSIVLSLDMSLVTKGGPIVGAWASTHRAPS